MPLTQHFDVAHETESARAAYFLYKGSGGKIHRGALGMLLEDRMIKIYLETDLETIKGFEARPFVALAHFQAFANTDEAFMGVLLFNARGLQEEYKRSGAAVHDRYFGGAQIHVRVVYTQPGER